MHSEQHFGTWLSSPAAFCPPVPLRAVPPQPEQHHVHPPHTPELTWTPLAFFHNYWNPPGNLQQNQGTVNLENWADTSLIPADLQYKTEPYKHQHLGDFRALVTMGKLGISPKEPQFCDPHAGSTSAPPAAPTGCSPSQCPQDTPRKATCIHRGGDFALLQVPPAVHNGWSYSDFHREMLFIFYNLPLVSKHCCFHLSMLLVSCPCTPSTTDNGRKWEKWAEVMKKSEKTMGEIKIK